VGDLYVAMGTGIYFALLVMINLLDILRPKFEKILFINLKINADGRYYSG